VRALTPIALAVLLACGAPPAGGPSIRITIPAGASFRAVTDSLGARDLLQSPRWFRLLARVRGVDRSVKAGVYDLPAGASAWQLLTALEAGRMAMVRFTAPEGLTLLDLADLARDRLDIPADQFLAAARDSALRTELHVEARTLEGYLLPQTYNLPVPVTAEGLVRAMVSEFERQWRPEWDRRLDSLGMTRNQLLALAAIVEGEARHAEERPVIAGVYTNRLRRSMPLQADPTVQYAIELVTGNRKQRLLFKDLEIQSPYNTYLHSGLPPGPVNSPGISSIEAALYPAAVPWLYFVAGTDGHHVFSRTLTEHNRAIDSVHRAQRNAR
jgi:UPF0755 protein